MSDNPVPVSATSSTSDKNSTNNNDNSVAVAASPSSASSSSSKLNVPAASPNSHKRHSSIIDYLSSPPPIQTTGGATRTERHQSNASDDSAIVVGRDWHEIQLNELVEQEKLLSVDADTSVEKAFEVLQENGFTSLPIHFEDKKHHEEHHEKNKETIDALSKGSVDIKGVTHTFDYADLNAYLLLVLGHIEPIEQTSSILESVVKARAGKAVPVKFVAQLGLKDPFVTVSATSTIATAVEILGKGVHRIAVTAPNDPSQLIGILSQRRLIRYIWENGRLFKNLEPLFQTSLQELDVASSNVISINGDDLVIEALKKMHQEGVSSVAVTDSKNLLLGNISVVDVRLLTKSTDSKYLKYTCKQFLTVILSNRGLEDGKDSFPVFHVTLDSTLGRTIAKLVATKAHRLWIVQQPSDNQPIVGTSGSLIGVISLTDILNILAKRAGKGDVDPTFARRQRRSSSSSSVRGVVQDIFRRPSVDSRR